MLMYNSNYNMNKNNRIIIFTQIIIIAISSWVVAKKLLMSVSCIIVVICDFHATY